MRLLRRILLWLLAIIAGAVVFLAGSVAVDALLGRGRVDALSNTYIADAGAACVRVRSGGAAGVVVSRQLSVLTTDS